MKDLSIHFIDYGDYKAHSFKCMGGLCETIIETSSVEVSQKIFNVIYEEAKRIEAKYSRYVKGNVVDLINTAEGRAVKIDTETYGLLSFADSLYHASKGLFDITSGVLRRVWVFDGSESTPDKVLIQKNLLKVGWESVVFNKKTLKIPSGWELDFGGIGKEYAVDSCCAKAKSLKMAPTLINFGGDIAVTGPKKNNTPWRIDVDQSAEKIMLFNGGVATSGDKNKFLMYKNKKLSHILNPKTGWPIEDAPRSVTVVGHNCVEAGSLATIALLKGKNAEEFLKSEVDQFKVIW